MRELHLIGVHEDGAHLILGDGEVEFVLPIDDALRVAMRSGTRPGDRERARATALRPTEVQSLIRAGMTAEEAAERAGWSVEKVRRYETPILAEREYMAAEATKSHVPGRGQSGPVTLAERVASRLAQRGVPDFDTSWDSWRSEDGQWTVELRFPAGGRQRLASWHFSKSSMTVRALDDEARWLSEDEQDAQAASLAGAGIFTGGPAGIAPSSLVGRPGALSYVYDVEAEGGVDGEDASPAGFVVTPSRGRASASGAGQRGVGSVPTGRGHAGSESMGSNRSDQLGAPAAAVAPDEEGTRITEDDDTRRPSRRRTPSAGRAGHSDRSVHPDRPGREDADLDEATRMHSRAGARSGRRRVSRRTTTPIPPPSTDPAALPLETPEAALPRPELNYDPATMGLPPAAHERVVPDEVDPEIVNAQPRDSRETRDNRDNPDESPRDNVADDVAVDLHPDPDADPADEAGEEPRDTAPPVEVESDDTASLLPGYDEDVDISERDADAETVGDEAALFAEPTSPTSPTSTPSAPGRAAESSSRPEGERTPGSGTPSVSVASDTVEEPHLPLDTDEPVSSGIAERTEPTAGTVRTAGAEAGTSPANSEQQSAAKGKQPRRSPGSNRRKGRASVPSWDDIMFGAKPADRDAE